MTDVNNARIQFYTIEVIKSIISYICKSIEDNLFQENIYSAKFENKRKAETRPRLSICL